MYYLFVFLIYTATPLLLYFFLYLSVHFFASCETKIHEMKVLRLLNFSRKALIFNHGDFGLSPGQTESQVDAS